jgi:hypothetical protein
MIADDHDNRLIPAGWSSVTLDDVAIIVMGQAPPGRVVVDWEGPAAAAGDGLPFLQGSTVSFSSYLVRLRANTAVADPYWLHSYLNMPATQDRLRRMATPGVSQANINPTNLRSLLVPCPPLDEQLATATLMSELHERIEVERRHG